MIERRDGLIDGREEREDFAAVIRETSGRTNGKGDGRGRGGEGGGGGREMMMHMCCVYRSVCVCVNVGGTQLMEPCVAL